VTAINSELAPPEDELVTEIIARRKRRAPKLTLALVVLVAAGAAFALGALAQKRWGASSGGSGSRASAFAAFASRAGAAGAGGAASRAGGFGGFGGFGGAGAFETGTVTLIKGSTLYVTDATGNTVLVRTTPRSTVTRTVGGSVKSIVPGDTVTVTGTRAANGSYTARSIAIGRVSNG
jgi:hypothetical protein